MELPSNHVPWRTEPSSWWIGIVTALTWPMMSVNWSWMKRTPLALAASILAVDPALMPTFDDASRDLRDGGRTGGGKDTPGREVLGRASIGRSGAVRPSVL